MFVSDDRDREFEERRKKIEIEQDLIYQQEEQHFREVKIFYFDPGRCWSDKSLPNPAQAVRTKVTVIFVPW